MFEDLKQRADLKAQQNKAESDRKKEVAWLFRRQVEEVYPEIETLGFVKTTLYTISDKSPTFTLRIQTRRGYSDSSFTHNLELNTLHQTIRYGSGAHSYNGKEMPYDINWNDSKLIAAMKDAIRALVAGALNSKSVIEAKGWNK